MHSDIDSEAGARTRATVFSYLFATLRALLRSASGIYFSKKLSTFPTHMLDNGSELSKCGVEHVLTKHPLGADTVVQVFHEDHVTSIAKRMSLLVVEIFPSIVDVVMKSRYFKT
jgi:hypothetical protein